MRLPRRGARQSTGRRRSALVWLRRDLPASRRSLEPRVGRVGRRVGAAGALASVSSSASRARAACRLRCCERYSDAAIVSTPSTSRWSSRDEQPLPDPLGQRRGPPYVEGQLDPRVGGVHRLPAGTAGAAEPPGQLLGRDLDAPEGERTVHARRDRRLGAAAGHAARRGLHGEVDAADEVAGGQRVPGAGHVDDVADLGGRARRRSRR